MHPVDLAVFRGRLQQIVDEMDLVHARAAFSPAISEMWDRANAIIDAERLEVVMQGTTGLPIFVATMQAAARYCVHELAGEFREGDVVMMNDPYGGGTHLQDVKMLRPVFSEGRLVLLLINTGHLIDIGGANAGAFDPAATSIFQEGLQMSPFFLAREGVIRQDILRLVLHNTRLPNQQYGDLRAQLNALDVGARRIGEVIKERGIDSLLEAIDELADRSEKQMRSYLLQVADGDYRFHDVVETNGPDLAIEICLSFASGQVTVDFEGSSPADQSAMNLTRHTTVTAVLSAFKHLFPSVPINGGCFRPFEFRFPDDCFLAAESPHAVGGYPEAAQRVMDAVIGALAEALPDVASAATFGSSASATLSGGDGQNFFATVLPMSGGYGASKGSDGLVHGPTGIGLAKFHKLEASEHEYPIVWERMEIRADSGGEGQWRGGPGTLYRLRVVAPVHASILADRARHQPFGVAGGRPGAGYFFEMMTARGPVGGVGVNATASVDLRPGDWIEMRSPGGGGYGDPERRAPELIEEDIRSGVTTRSDE